MKYFVYILNSLETGHYYIGQTKDLDKRIDEHNSGKSKSTKSGIPWVLVYEEAHDSRSSAFKKEQELKKIRKRSILEKYIAG